MQLSCCSCGPSTVLSQFHSKEGIRNPVVFTATLSTVSKCPRQHTPWKNDVGEFLYQGWQLTSTLSMWQNRFDNECKQHGRETREHIWSTKTLNYLERVVIAPQTPSIKKKKTSFITTTYSAPRDPGSIIINQKRFNYRETHCNAIVSELQNGSRRQFWGFTGEE